MNNRKGKEYEMFAGIFYAVLPAVCMADSNPTKISIERKMGKLTPGMLSRKTGENSFGGKNRLFFLFPKPK